MSKFLLSICIPTCNRKEVLVATIEKLLTCKDDRFSITISDNQSEDGLIEEISKIDSNRLFVLSTPPKIAAYANYNQVIQIAQAEYVLHVLDKEKINVNYLTDFLDFLETEQPYFGLVDIFCKNNVDRFKLFPKGVYSVLNGGGGGDTHPSGFYYRKSIYVEEYNRIKEILGNGNLWVLDIVSAGLGAQYDSMVYYKPLVSYDREVILSGKTFSPYTEKTIYWYGGKRIETLRLFIKSVLSIERLSKVERKSILYGMLEKHLLNMTWTQITFFRDELRCNHYGLSTRRVGVFESIKWMYLMLKAFCNETKTDVSIDSMLLCKICMKGVRSSILLNYPALNIFSRNKKK